MMSCCPVVSESGSLTGKGFALCESRRTDAGLVRGVQGSHEPFPDDGANQAQVRRRVEGLQDGDGNGAIPVGRVAAFWSDQKTGEGSRRSAARDVEKEVDKAKL